MLGMKVTCKLVVEGVHKVEVLRNVTEIHYCYRPYKVAFESDIHRTGITYNLVPSVLYIYEFEVVVETEQAKEF